jgi:hypothetical protein
LFVGNNVCKGYRRRLSEPAEMIGVSRSERKEVEEQPAPIEFATGLINCV